MYTLKSIVRRGTPLAAVVAMVAATLAPTTAVFADSLNPLTDRSLLLSSSAPGFTNTDGSGNTEDSPNANGDNFAPAGSGPNGMKTGETFTFKVSTDSAATNTPIKAFSFQYCTTAAGDCQAPGDNAGDARDGAATPRDTNADGLAADPKTSDLDVVSDGTTPWAGGTGAGQFQIYQAGNPVDMTGWTMTTANAEDTAYNNPEGRSDLTGKKNYIVLAYDGTGTDLEPTFNQEIQVVFKASSTNFITNPGSGAFFVKLNTYKIGDPGTNNENLAPTTNANVLDGGVTVANVMTESIHITTKVLETMKFSVGTQNPDNEAVQHGSCDAIDVVNGNRLDLGNPSAENSLSTESAYDTHSYWRLSSNSSGGAVVYYSGDTLQNTVGDDIDPMTTTAHSQPGTEQFGLALVDAGGDTPDAEGTDADGTNDFPANWSEANIDPLDIEPGYDGGDGTGTISDETTANNAQFTFKAASLSNPVAIASESDSVISCATSKVRYVGNIAADTPAGVYTTKINYLAAPQY